MPNYRITEKDSLYRRVPKTKPNCWKLLNGVRIPSDIIFKTKPNEDGLSVNIAELITPELTVERFPDFVVAEFLASIPIEQGYECVHKPSSTNYSHAIIKGDTNPIAMILSNSVIHVHEF